MVDALKAVPFAGVVARLAKSEDPTTRTMRAEVDLPNPDGRLVEGMYGRATIELQPPTENLTHPRVLRRRATPANGKAAAFVVRDGKARRTPITIGDDDGSMVEVLSGLESGGRGGDPARQHPRRRHAGRRDHCAIQRRPRSLKPIECLA